MTRLRTLTDADLAGACRLLAECYAWLGARGEYSEAQVRALVERRATTTALRRRGDDELRLVALAPAVARGDCATDVIGLATASADELTRLYVAPAHHGAGIGSRLLAEVERRQHAAGHAQLVLGTTASALPFYLARRVFLTGVKAHGLPGFEDRRVLLMRKELGAGPRPYLRLQVRYCGKLAKPVGVFGACHHLRRAGRLSEDDDRLFTEVEGWFTEHLPEPPFYADGNPRRVITWFKRSAGDMLARIEPLVSLLERHGVPCDRVVARDPGVIVYEDRSQVGVV